MPRRPQTQDELQKHLEEQVAFLKSSAKSYDEGNLSEGKRLASVIRTLVHDTASSHSLLNQLGLKGRNFTDTSQRPGPGKIIGSYHGLICVPAGTPGGEYIPLLYPGAYQESQNVSFDEWWNGRPVIIDGSGNNFTRRDLVLAVANTDGGSHVDPGLNEKYAALSRDNSLGWSSGRNDSDSEPLQAAPLACMRQITHELLLSLGEEPVTPEKKVKSPLLVGPITISKGKQPVPKGRDRNQPCPCGSGKKYKKCHWE